MNSKFKRLILLLCIPMLVISCDPDHLLDPKYNGLWVIENKTSDTLNIWHSRFNTVIDNLDDKFTYNLPPDSVINIQLRGIGNSPSEATFDVFFAEKKVGDNTFSISSLVNDELKVWKQSEKDLPGKQFFNEDFWTKREWKVGGKRAEKIHYEWTFKILPEDIEQ